LRVIEQVANAAAADLNVFITCDEKIRQALSFVERQYGLRILRPAEVIVHIDELVRAESYRPVELLSTTYVQRLVHDDEVAVLANREAGESPDQLQALMRKLALAGRDRMGVFTPTGDIAALFAANVDGGVLEVPLLRAASDTLARQLMFTLRAQAREAGITGIRISDPRLTRAVSLAASDEGFFTARGCLHGFAVDLVGPASEVGQSVTSAARRAGLPEPPPLGSGMPAVAAAELERIWWPAKLADSTLRSYLIPIQQVYSADLLGIPSGLLPRNDVLGLAREHVYYKRPGGTQVQAPARLLWYMSEGGRTAPLPAAVIASSHLDEVVTGPPEELHARFQHLGVWDREAVVQAARDGRVQALRFTNTEIFPTAVPRARLRALSLKFASHAEVPFGPRSIPVELFTALYEEGRAS
jgi:hypothetical protein